MRYWILSFLIHIETYPESENSKCKPKQLIRIVINKSIEEGDVS